MPKVGDKISAEDALRLPATRSAIADLCDRLNRRYHSGYARMRYADKQRRAS